MRDAFGELLSALRRARGTSQRRLAHDAEVSPRHLSWLETGKSRPSREMVLVLGSALDLPLRDRNRLLLAAEFAPAYEETPLDDDAMSDVRHAIDLLLRAHEPHPAAVLDRAWNVTYVNRGFAALHRAITSTALRPYVRLEDGPNLVDAFFTTYAASVRNASAVLEHMLPRLRREALREPELARRLAQWPRAHRGREQETARSPVVVPFELALGGAIARLFTTYTALGTPSDITTDEIVIELFHPADRATKALLATLAAD